MNTARKRRPWRTLLVVLLCLALAGLLVAGFWPKPVPVQTATVTRGPMIVTVTEEGKTRIRSRYVVFPPTAGFLQRVELRAGARITAGETVLAVLTPEPSTFLTPRMRAEALARLEAAEATVRARRAERERVHTSLELARRDLARIDALLADGAVARRDWDRADNEVRVLERELQAASFALQVAEHEAGVARAALSRDGAPDQGEAVPILAPVDGYVLAVMEESARSVAPSTPIMEVGDPGDLEIEIELLSVDAVAVVPGAEAVIEHWGGEGSLRARVTVVEPGGFTKVSAIGVEEQRVKVRAELTDPLPEGIMLGDRYGVQARIVTWRGEDVPRIPTSAVFRQAGEWKAFALENGRAALRTVAIGRENGLEAEVLEGLREGETVILHPPDTLEDGARVEEQGR
jgi:HlyD family secretion protein